MLNALRDRLDTLTWHLEELEHHPRAALLAQLPTAGWLAFLVGWMHRGAFGPGVLLGGAGTDALRAAWGFDHAAQAWPFLPFWTSRIGFPEGVKVVVLPGVSSMLGLPLHAAAGPVTGYNLWLVGMLWLLGMAAALLATRVARTAAAGLVAGTFTVVQPITLFALSDGTAEHVAGWALPATLAALAALRSPSAPRWMPWMAGALATVMVLDSPYNAVFALPFLPVVGMPPLGPDAREARTRWMRRVAEAAAVALVGAALVGWIYHGFPLGTDDARRDGNSIRLEAWRAWEGGRRWETSFAATFVPSTLLVGSVVLAALRPMRGGAWVVLAALCLVLGLGPGTQNVDELRHLAGEAGGRVGAAIAAFNEQFPAPIVRFPRRWLFPAGLALAVGAGVGLSRVSWSLARWPLAALLAYGTARAGLHATGYSVAVPMHTPPQPAFATWIAEHDEDGAILPVPRMRASNRASVQRSDQPVFASLGVDLASSDQYWFQVLCGRPSVFSPVGLRTMVARRERSPELARFFQALDDLTLPQTVGRPIPPSSTDDLPGRQARARDLRDRGLGFVVGDEAALAPEGIALLRETFAPLLSEERHFDDGTGVVVFVLGEDAP